MAMHRLSMHALRTLAPAVAALAALAAAPGVQACSSCGCTLSSNWGAQGEGMDNGFMFDFLFAYFLQSALPAGSHDVIRSYLSIPTDREIQQTTINRNYTADLDY